MARNLDVMRKNSDPAAPFWSYSPERVLQSLRANAQGLSPQEINERLKHFGANRFRPESKFNLLAVVLEQFRSPLIFILLAAGGLTIFLAKWVDATVIALAIIVNTALGTYQETKAGNALERLKTYIRERARVVRAGQEQEVDAETLVPGDIIHLAYGGRVPADARLLSVNDCAVDESLLTGESLPVNKTIAPLSEATTLPDRTNMVFGGTLVTGGYGVAVVTATGRATELGQIADLVSQATEEETPLQRSVAKLAWLIAAIVITLVGGIFALGIYRGETVIQMFLVSAAVAVGSIPEALPIALTVVLAVGVERLAKRQGVMRRLGAAETLGSTSVIITDKTGTLTEANMRLVNILTVDQLLNRKMELDDSLAKNFSVDQKNILTLAALNTKVLVENPDDPPVAWQLVGRSLETNIFKSLIAQKLDPRLIQNQARAHLVIPFSSEHRFSASLIHGHHQLPPPLNRQTYTLLCLGAPDTLLQKSKLPKNDYLRLIEAVNVMSQQGKRLLGIAIKNVRSEKIGLTLKAAEVDELEFLGLLAFYDPLRAGVPEAIRQIEAAGIKVVIATGDLPGTAVAVARGLGWSINPGQVLTGEEMRQLADDDLKNNLDNIKIFARVTPADKMRLGRLHQARGEVVGMTGDGVNDAPSLKAVDIGIAVGSGSDVAKEVADLVLLNDNFETIVRAIEEGRRILLNIRKTFIYLMSTSLDEVLLTGGSLLLGLPMPLSALQIIWVNFFTGSLPALSFAFDHSADQRQLTVRDAKIVLNREVKLLSLGIGLLNSFILLGLYWWLMRQGWDDAVARTFLFTCFASYILFAAFSLRQLHQPIFRYHPFTNRFLNTSVLIGLGLIALTIYLPLFQKIFGTTALPFSWLIWVAVCIIVNVGIVEIAKWIYRSANRASRPTGPRRPMGQMANSPALANR